MFIKATKTIKFYLKTSRWATLGICLLALAMPALLFWISTENPEFRYRCWQLFEMLLIIGCLLMAGGVLSPWYDVDSSDIMWFRAKSPLPAYALFLLAGEILLLIEGIVANIISPPMFIQAIRPMVMLLIVYEVLLLLAQISKRVSLALFATVGMVIWAYLPAADFDIGLKVTGLVLTADNLIKAIVPLLIVAAVLAVGVAWSFRENKT